MCTTSYMKTQKLFNCMGWNTICTQSRIFFLHKKQVHTKNLKRTHLTRQDAKVSVFMITWDMKTICNFIKNFRFLQSYRPNKKSLVWIFFPYHLKDTFLLLLLFLTIEVLEAKISKTAISLNLPR